LDTPFNLFGAAAGADAVPSLELFGSRELRPLVGIRCSAAVPALFFGGQLGFFFSSRLSSSPTTLPGGPEYGVAEWAKNFF